MSPRKKEDNESIREERRKSILEVALSLFANKGYESTSISQLAKEAGISKGLIYTYFESKEALLKKDVELNIKPQTKLKMTFSEIPEIFIPESEFILEVSLIQKDENELRSAEEIAGRLEKFYNEKLKQKNLKPG